MNQTLAQLLPHVFNFGLLFFIIFITYRIIKSALAKYKGEDSHGNNDR